MAVEGGIEGLADKVACELRRVQSDLADEPQTSREEMLGVVIDRATTDLSPAQRGPFMAALERRFPSWDSGVSSGGVAPVARSAFDEAELARPDFLVRKLLEVASKLSGEERQAIGDRLAAAGIRPAPAHTGSGWSAQADQKLRGVLNHRPEDPMNPDRLAMSAAEVLAFVGAVESQFWPVWSKIAPQSQYRKGRSVDDLIRRFTREEADVGGSMITEELARLRLLFFYLFNAVAQAALEAQREYADLAPRAIQTAVDRQGVGLMQAKKTAYWDEYCKAYDSFMASGGMKERLMAAIAEFVETKVRAAAAANTKGRPNA